MNILWLMHYLNLLLSVTIYKCQSTITQGRVVDCKTFFLTLLKITKKRLDSSQVDSRGTNWRKLWFFVYISPQSHSVHLVTRSRFFAQNTFSFNSQDQPRQNAGLIQVFLELIIAFFFMENIFFITIWKCYDCRLAKYSRVWCAVLSLRRLWTDFPCWRGSPTRSWNVRLKHACSSQLTSRYGLIQRQFYFQITPEVIFF